MSAPSSNSGSEVLSSSGARRAVLSETDDPPTITTSTQQDVDALVRVFVDRVSPSSSREISKPGTARNNHRVSSSSINTAASVARSGSINNVAVAAPANSNSDGDNNPSSDDPDDESNNAKSEKENRGRTVLTPRAQRTVTSSRTDDGRRTPQQQRSQGETTTTAPPSVTQEMLDSIGQFIDFTAAKPLAVIETHRQLWTQDTDQSDESPIPPPTYTAVDSKSKDFSADAEVLSPRVLESIGAFIDSAVDKNKRSPFVRDQPPAEKMEQKDTTTTTTPQDHPDDFSQLTMSLAEGEAWEELNEILSAMEQTLATSTTTSDTVNPELYSMIDRYIQKFANAYRYRDDDSTIASGKVPEESQVRVSEFIDMVQEKRAQEDRGLIPIHLLQLMRQKAKIIAPPKDPPSGLSPRARDPPLHSKSFFREQLRGEPETNPAKTKNDNALSSSAAAARDPDDSPSGPVFDDTPSGPVFEDAPREPVFDTTGELRVAVKKPEESDQNEVIVKLAEDAQKVVGKFAEDAQSAASGMSNKVVVEAGKGHVSDPAAPPEKQNSSSSDLVKKDGIGNISVDESSEQSTVRAAVHSGDKKTVEVSASDEGNDADDEDDESLSSSTGSGSEIEGSEQDQSQCHPIDDHVLATEDNQILEESRLQSANDNREDRSRVEEENSAPTPETEDPQVEASVSCSTEQDASVSSSQGSVSDTSVAKGEEVTLPLVDVPTGSQAGKAMIVASRGDDVSKTLPTGRSSLPEPSVLAMSARDSEAGRPNLQEEVSPYTATQDDHGKLAASTPKETEGQKKTTEGEKDPIASSDDMKRLATLMFLSVEPSPDDVKRIAHVLCFAFPHVRDRDPPASAVSRIMLEARHANLQLDVADRLLGLVHTLHERDMSDIDYAPSDELVAFQTPSQQTWGHKSSVASKNAVLGFVKSLLTVAERDPYLTAALEKDDLDVSITFSDGDEAIEVDLREGFGDKNLSLAKSGEEPWWEIVARLQGKEMDRKESAVSSLGRTSIDKKESALPCTPQTSIEETVDKSDACSEQGSGRGSRGSRSFSESESAGRSFSKVNASRSSGAVTNENSGNDEGFEDYWHDRQKKKLWKRFGYPAKTIEENVLDLSFFGDEISTRGNTALSLKSFAFSTDSDEEMWILRRSMASWTKNGVRDLWRGKKKLASLHVSEPKRIDAVAASARLFTLGSFRRGTKDMPQLTQQWKRTYMSRTERHTGYFGVHVCSLNGSSFPPEGYHALDDKPWEHRTVRQRFLFEQSVSFCRNWFGLILPKRGNPVVDYSPVRVESMPMPVKAAEWTDDWYQKPWPQPLDTTMSGASNPKNSTMRRFDFAGSNQTAGPYENPFDDEETLMDVPECGRIRNTKLKIGERISRVTPELTSSLRGSRWRRKHFPRGTFPY